jgi:hypothetical protein
VSACDPCYNQRAMEGRSSPAASGEPQGAVEPAEPRHSAPSPAELKARRVLIGGLVAAAVLLVAVVVTLIVLAIDAYQGAQAGAGPSPGAVVIEILRDAAIVIVGFESIIIGALLIILVLLLQSLIVLFRDEIGPALDAANETLATVRGTTRFVSEKVVSPLMKWSSYLAGVRRILRAIGGLREDEE